MRVKSIRLRNFKRFTDLTVRDIPATAKIVVVVGPNGCGKSSLFDAMLSWYTVSAGFGGASDEPYFRKDKSEPFGWHENIEVVTDRTGQVPRGALYVRSAYRNEPDFAVTGVSKQNSPVDEVRFRRVIENDQTVGANYQRLVYDTLSGVYDSGNDRKLVETLRNELIGGLRASMAAVFGELALNNISDPLGNTTFLFDKGTARSYHYKNLSGGEKAAFDLLLDLHVKRKHFPDAIYCIDELETHLHTAVQGVLLKELANIIPERSQLWVTTHSLGVLRAAQEIAAVAPETVAVIDFDGIDPDVPQEIVPSDLGRIAWEKMLSIALGDLSQRVAPETIVICEGSSIGNQRKDFDAEIYTRILGNELPGLVFVSGGSSNQVEAVGASVRGVLERVVPRTRFVSIIDRDDMSEREVDETERRGCLVLRRRNLEGYLFADDVLHALAASVNRHADAPACIQARDAAIEECVTQGRPRDDLKAAAGRTYVAIKRILGLTRVGNNADTFMRDTLAPLIRPGMATHEALRADILDRVRALR